MPWKTSIPLKDMSHICVCEYDRMIHLDRKHSPKLALMLITAWKALENLKVLDMCCSKISMQMIHKYVSLPNVIGATSFLNSLSKR